MKRDAEEQRQREQAMMERVNELAQYNMLGTAKLKGATFDTTEQREDGAAAFDAGRQYVMDFEAICKRGDDMKGLLLYGPPGTGKTHLAACIANALMARYVPVLFTSVIELTGLFEDELGEVLRRMRSAKLLVLDDLGAERSTDFKVEQVYNVVNSRCNDMKPMIVTTNCTLDEMRGEKDLRYRRIWERVRSMCRPVRMDGESWRKRRTVEAIKRMKEG
jgi:DNA replication protein DnaC